MESAKNKITEQLEKMKNEYTSDFIESLVKLKVTLIVLFITISVIYLAQENELLSHGNIHVYTMLHSDEYLKKLIFVASLDGLFGALSFMFILGSRGGWGHVVKNINSHIKEILLTATILFLFRFSQESSGFNRWMYPHSSIYKNIDEKEKEDLEKIMVDAELKKLNAASPTHVLSEQRRTAIMKKLEAQYASDIKIMDKISPYTYESGFGMAVEKTAIGGIGLFSAYYMIKMLMSTFYGYSSGTQSLESQNITNMQFVGELTSMFVFNSIPSIVAPFIYGQEHASHDVVMGLGMGTVSVIIHVLFQYAGLYSGLGHNE